MSIIYDELKAIHEAMRGDNKALPECTECEGDGWVLASYQSDHPPIFETCPKCLNPKDRPSP